MTAQMTFPRSGDDVNSEHRSTHTLRWPVTEVFKSHWFIIYIQVSQFTLEFLDHLELCKDEKKKITNKRRRLNCAAQKLLDLFVHLVTVLRSYRPFFFSSSFYFCQKWKRPILRFPNQIDKVKNSKNLSIFNIDIFFSIFWKISNTEHVTNINALPFM